MNLKKIIYSIFLKLMTGAKLSIHFFVFFCFLFLVCPVVSSAETSCSFLLDNGLTVVVNEMPSTTRSAIYVWVKAGSADEGQYSNSGISHLIEHMLFKGTDRRKPGMISQEAQSLGGDINAATSYDFTVFTLDLPADNFLKGLDLMADMVQHPLFDAAEIEKERAVILKEMRMVNDRPERRLNNLLYASIFMRHPYRFPIIGNESVFNALTRDDLLGHFRSFYVPGNMILSVAGPFKAEDIVSEIKKAFSGALPSSFPSRNLPVEPEQIFSRKVETEYPTDLYRLTLAYQGVPLFHDDLYALDVLAMALGDGKSSRFYDVLFRNKKLVQSVSASNSTPLDRGFFEVAVLMNSDRSRAVLKAVKDIIEDVKKRGLRSDELDMVKRQVMVDNINDRQTAGGMAYRAAIETAFTGDFHFSDRYLEGIRAVKNEDIRRVAGKYLVDQKLTTVFMRPVKEIEVIKDSAASVKNLTKKHVLSNGVRILVREDHTLPIVTVRLAFMAGTSQEPTDKAGISVLTGAIWSRAFKGLSALKLSRQVESRGGTLFSYSGKSNFLLGMDFLSEDVDLVFTNLEKLVKYPVFPQEEIDLQKNKMLTAVKMRRDNPAQMAARLSVETLFLTHPFRYDGLGNDQTLSGISREDVVHYFDRFLDPGGMIISVFGDIDPAAVTARLEKMFGGLLPRNPGIKAFVEPPPEELRIREIDMDKEQAVFTMSFRAPIVTAEDRFALEAAVNILASPLTGRISKRVREELGKAYALGGYYSPGVDAGMTLFFVNTVNEDIPVVRNIMQEEFRKLQIFPVSNEELVDTKVCLISRHLSAMETLSGQAGSSVINELFGLGYNADSMYSVKMNEVTADAVQKAAIAYFDPGHSAIVVVRSKEKAKEIGK